MTTALCKRNLTAHSATPADWLDIVAGLRSPSFAGLSCPVMVAARSASVTMNLLDARWEMVRHRAAMPTLAVRLRAPVWRLLHRFTTGGVAPEAGYFGGGLHHRR